MAGENAVAWSVEHMERDDMSVGVLYGEARRGCLHVCVLRGSRECEHPHTFTLCALVCPAAVLI